MPELMYPHNREAYAAAVAMMGERGKAAVVHPTGTGKSFIGFQLCRDHPEARICWLSPSEYIFQTQVENWQAAGGGALENVQFYTYAKLPLLTDGELEDIRADYMILDEFHRCGARVWGQGVRRLLDSCPGARLLGLSATSVRYLDNQRDMADELFDGNVAAEMTLGEAIVRGILRQPRYVLSAYAYQNSLADYRRRVERLKSDAARDEAWALLEALRRALDRADGLDVIFQKHMENRRGKYLVFCANVAHMDEMMAHVPAWFGAVDPAPHVYRAYADCPQTRRAFAQFRADESDHLKLLFCIDMFNEGVHVGDVAGVILFRPTVSPIIYKQQIGRALSAGGAGEPVIFDVVNNIENLYSIGAVQREMEEASQAFRFYGQGERIVHDRFEVFDEVRSCRALFAQLEERLTASWDVMYRHAEDYYRAHGNLQVPRRYRTAEGYALGNWIATQRRVWAGSQYGSLDEERIAKLDALGMVWEDRGTAGWNRCFAALEQYRAARGDLDVPAAYVTEDGLALGKFVSHLRTARSTGKNGSFLTEERIRQLDGLGMIWDKLDYQWERYYLACAGYYVAHRSLDIPAGYVSPEGLKLGAWLRRMRRARSGRGPGRLTAEQIRRLDEIGMVWEDAYTRQWEYGYGQAVKWYEAHHNLEVPATYVDEDGFALGKWIRRHREVDARTGRQAIQLTPERREKLDALGMTWEKKPDPWETRYALARSYYLEHGNLRVPADYRPDGIWLGKWINEQKQIYRGNRAGKSLSREQVQRLEQIGITWGAGRPERLRLPRRTIARANDTQQRG